MAGGYCFLPSQLSSAIVELLSSGGQLTLPGIYKEIQQILALKKFCLVRPVDISSESGGDNTFTTALPCALNPLSGAVIVSFLFGDSIIALSVNENDTLDILSQGG